MSKPTTIGEILADWFSTVSDGTKYYPNGEYVQKSKAELAQLIRSVVPEKMGEGLQPMYSKGYNNAIYQFNTALNKVLGEK